VFAIDLVPELVRTGCAHGEVERSGPGTVALSDRVQPAYPAVRYAANSASLRRGAFQSWRFGVRCNAGARTVGIWRS
jgi:hypothetical protein